MGGRGSEYVYTNKWDFIEDISDYRLDRYGLMTSHHQDDVRKGAFNHNLAAEYAFRHGRVPSWYDKSGTEWMSDQHRLDYLTKLGSQSRQERQSRRIK